MERTARQELRLTIKQLVSERLPSGQLPLKRLRLRLLPLKRLPLKQCPVVSINPIYMQTYQIIISSRTVS